MPEAVPYSTPIAPELVWSDALDLAMPAMDEAHAEMVELIAQVQQAEDADLLTRWQTLVEHTEDHFNQENRWMTDTGFAPDNCHTTQHAVVLKVMKEGLDVGRQGVLSLIRQMAHELTVWLPHHAQTMDSGLALHLKSVGYDSASGAITTPQALPKQTIHGCSGSCNDDSDDSRDEAQPDAA